MYLTRSIIRFIEGDLDGAADDLNVVRKRAWDPVTAGIPYEASDHYVTSENITEQMIHLERIRELAFEGDWLIYCENLELPLLPGDRENTEEIHPPYTNLYWIIPQAELDFRTDE